MTDRELLELAAKAAGYRFLPEGGFAIACVVTGQWLGSWNPLTDDGDALRLAVKLRLDLDFEKLNKVSVWCTPIDSWVDEHCDDGMGADIEDKTRRAIVRAATEIGRSMG